jgi:hypothetical protein
LPKARRCKNIRPEGAQNITQVLPLVFWISYSLEKSLRHIFLFRVTYEVRAEKTTPKQNLSFLSTYKLLDEQVQSQKD